MKMLSCILGLVFSVSAMSAPVYNCELSGIVETQKHKFLSKKWKTKESRRSSICNKELVINLNLTANQTLLCESWSHATEISASIIGNEDFELWVKAGTMVRRGSNKIFEGKEIIRRDVLAGDGIDDEAAVEIVLSEDKKERRLLKSVRIKCSPKR